MQKNVGLGSICDEHDFTILYSSMPWCHAGANLAFSMHVAICALPPECHSSLVAVRESVWLARKNIL
jgi:hypothetical protein